MARGHGSRPDRLLQPLGARKLLVCRLEIRESFLHAQAGVQVFSEQVAQGRLVAGRQQIQAQIRGTDGVGFLDDQLSASVEAGGRAAEAEPGESGSERVPDL